jgi:hypothetical protein
MKPSVPNLDALHSIPAMKNKWSSGWPSSRFYCRVPLHKGEAMRKGVYPLHSEMHALDYMMVATHSYASDDINAMAFEEATKIIGGRDAVKELSDNWSLVVERAEAQLSKVTVPLLKVAMMIGKKETKDMFETRIASAAN